MRHHFINNELPIRPTGRERFIDVDLAGRFAILSRSKFIGDRAVICDEVSDDSTRQLGLWHRWWAPVALNSVLVPCGFDVVSVAGTPLPDRDRTAGLFG
jgi:hypothetical protein